MAKIVDITDKLTFDGNPSLKIKGKTLEVNADAPTMLKVMSLMGDHDPGVNEILSAYDMIFPKESKEELDAMKLGFADLVVVIQEAVGLIIGGEDSRGER